MKTSTSEIDWYFVCTRCECKFFHGESSIDCPRCGRSLTSMEQLTPPRRPRLLKVHEAAQRLSISISKTYHLIERGILPHHRIVGAIRISENQLEEYLSATSQQPKAERSPTTPPTRPRLRHLRL